MAFINKLINIPITDDLIRSNFPNKDLDKEYDNLQLTYNNKTPRLCDYYITGSYASYSCSNVKDSITNLIYLKKILQSGIRSIHLDLYNDNEGNVIVKGEKEENGINFIEVCELINNYIDSEEILSEYPFILYLNLKYDNVYYDLSDIIANNLKKNFNDKFPDIKYNFNRYKIGREYITNFKGKVIILLNRYNNGERLNEITHGVIYEEKDDNNDKHISKVKFSKNNISLKNKTINRFYDMNSIFGFKDKVIDKTKNDIIIVYTEDDYYFNMNLNDEKSSKNYGINICMNKFKVKDGLLSLTGDYMKHFRNNKGKYQPFILKQEKFMNNNKDLIIEQVNKNKTLQTDLNLKKNITFNDL